MRNLIVLNVDCNAKWSRCFMIFNECLEGKNNSLLT